MSQPPYRMSRRELLRLAPASSLALLLVGCGRSGDTPATPAPPTPTPDAPSPEFVGRRFLEAWQAGDYDEMYRLLSDEARARISREAFEARYAAVLNEATVYETESRLVAAGRFTAREGAAEFDLLYRTRLVGELRFRPRLSMILNDENNWRIDWSPAVIMPPLGDDNRLQLFPRTSTRGVVYDRNGEIMATQGAIVTLGVVPGQISDEGQVQALISELTGMAPGEIAGKYAGQPADWFIPIADISFEASQANHERLELTPGIQRRSQAVRAYPQRQTASHLVGYVGRVSADELTALGERGYEEDDFVGKQGIEAWGESILAGKKGGRLAVLSPENREIETLADIPAVQSRSLYLTLDLALQRACEEILGTRRGAIGIADVATGEVLALAAFPRYDPNQMANELDAQQRLALANAPEQPLVNLATLGVFPSGSLFKVITMTAAMERAGLPRSEPYFCSGSWNRLGFPMECWKKSGHLDIDLFHGLEQSCNVVFFETGLRLYNQSETALQEIAARYGIGERTGLEVDEVPGLLPTPQWKRDVLSDVWVPGDTVNLAIGQGFLQVTPAQMLRVMLAVASGGTVRELTLLNRAEDPTGAQQPEFFSKPEPTRLDVRAETLGALREAMRAVCVPPMGTASGVFGDYPIPIAGKTGTAESVPGRDSHAWFGGFAPYDQPRIAFVGMLEYGGEGSADAAPMVRQVLDRFFNVG